MNTSTRRIAVVGGGWAGLAAAVAATQAGQQVTLFEASRQLGGRARSLDIPMPDGSLTRLDNGQHILIGAYTHTLDLLRRLGIDPDQALLRRPLTLRYPDGRGLQLPAGLRLPARLALLLGLFQARGWTWADRSSLLRLSWQWHRQGYTCPADWTVDHLCTDATPRIQRELLEPLCVSALNTPMAQASAQVFLRVLQDALFTTAGGSDLLLPCGDIGALLPERAQAWLSGQGASVYLGLRVQALVTGRSGWLLQLAPSAGQPAIKTQAFDAIILATPATEAARLSTGLAPAWAAQARGLRHEAIATVYALAPAGTRLAEPMLALESGPQAPAQFVFDRGQLGGPAGLLAFVISAPQAERAWLQQASIDQGRTQLGLPQLQPLQTVLERRATFACTPGLTRPSTRVAPALWACGDYTAGPYPEYPATLEGAIRSGLAAVEGALRE